MKGDYGFPGLRGISGLQGVKGERGSLGPKGKCSDTSTNEHDYFRNYVHYPKCSLTETRLFVQWTLCTRLEMEAEFRLLEVFTFEF